MFDQRFCQDIHSQIQNCCFKELAHFRQKIPATMRPFAWGAGGWNAIRQYAVWTCNILAWFFPKSCHHPGVICGEHEDESCAACLSRAPKVTDFFLAIGYLALTIDLVAGSWKILVHWRGRMCIGKSEKEVYLRAHKPPWVPKNPGIYTIWRTAE